MTTTHTDTYEIEDLYVLATGRGYVGAIKPTETSHGFEVRGDLPLEEACLFTTELGALGGRDYVAPMLDCGPITVHAVDREWATMRFPHLFGSTQR